MIRPLIIYRENQWSLYQPTCFPLSREKLVGIVLNGPRTFQVPYIQDCLPFGSVDFTESTALVRLPRFQKIFYFFGHGRTKGVHARARQRFGRTYLYRWWKSACANLGIEGIDLYGGTHHSTVRVLRKMRTPEEIKRGSMHSTNKGFIGIFRLRWKPWGGFTGTQQLIPKKGAGPWTYPFSFSQMVGTRGFGPRAPESH